MSDWDKYRKKILVVCYYCNNEFKKTTSEFNRTTKNNNKNYCSKTCYNKNREKIKIKCKECNNNFIPKQKTNMFCSRSCSATFTNKKRKGEKRKFSKEGINNIKKANRKRTNYEINKIDYNKNPKTCKECEKKLKFNKRKNVFCDIKCKRKYNIRNLTLYQIYKNKCQFIFNLNNYPNEYDFKLVEKKGWYSAKNHGNNLNGISRDHIISISYGFKHKINPSIISHPANCQLMEQRKNSSKHKKCELTLDELISKINKWNKRYERNMY